MGRCAKCGGWKFFDTEKCNACYLDEFSWKMWLLFVVLFIACIMMGVLLTLLMVKP